MNELLGMKVHTSDLAREVRDEWRVEKVPIKKRRRGWRVVKHHIDRPSAYVYMGRTLIIHPELFDAMKKKGHIHDRP